MNLFGFTMFNKEVIAAEVEKRTGKQVKLGRMNWHADSYHIYGKDIINAKQRLFDRLKITEFEDRTFNLNDEIIGGIYDEAEEKVIEKIKNYDAEQNK